ncbi:LIM/homeobox protein Lhx3-like [Venturia canescens]|uniref:LIM/homeobox protein Lhx3-like n=1 Tax=Venturia canescens TaxID=32260 RepID=UPI001C9CBD02|nr:LIM/homeobox protein Lhx3-like [Venturia canescens]
MTTEKAMSEIFKPVMNPLEKLVDQSVKQESAIKKEPNEESSVKKEDEFIDNEDDEFERSFQTAHGDISEEDISFEDDDDSIKRDDLSQNYLNMFDTVEKKELDTSYGDTLAELTMRNSEIIAQLEDRLIALEKIHNISQKHRVDDSELSDKNKRETNRESEHFAIFK